MEAFISSTSEPDLELRPWPEPPFPELPYPLLLPYLHPALLAGRERELAELAQILRLPMPILGVYGPSGVGKSSLLAAGLVPVLRADGLPTAYDRHPDEPGIARRLVECLVRRVGDGRSSASSQTLGIDLDDGDLSSFVERIRWVHRLARGAPVLVLDQFENLLRPDRRDARREIGRLLAASVRRRPGIEGPLCRWVLAYRGEFHGKTVAWLRDVLYESRCEDPGRDLDLPHDLSGADRFQAWRIPALGAPERGGAGFEARARAASDTFRAAIEAPLALRRADCSPRYPWRFDGDGAERLARAFGRARAERPDAPLTPELQVTLAHLLARAEQGTGDEAGTRVVRVPERPGSLIDEALEEHLRRALDAAFPSRLAPDPPGELRRRRTRAVLALRELADAHGRREAGLPAEVLARAVGPDGEQVLQKLSAPASRLVVLEEQAGEWRFVLSHDAMAEVIVRLCGEEGNSPSPELLAAFHRRLSIDEELLELRRLVALKTELFRAGEIDQATALSAAAFRRIATDGDALLWHPDQRRWWRACEDRRRRDRRRLFAGSLAALVVLAALLWGIGSEVSRRAERQARLEQLATAEPAEALSALLALADDPEVSEDALLARLRERGPRDLFERGVGGLPEARRAEAATTAAERVLPLVQALGPDGPNVPLLASVAWALDFFPAGDPEAARRAGRLREAVAAPLRRLHRPPPPPGDGDPGWASIPAGTLTLGGEPGDRWHEELFANEKPRHPAEVSAFRIMKHEVAAKDFRRLFPDHPGGSSADSAGEPLPAVEVDWYHAYAYALWLGGRLPTEAEWEYAARGGCEVDFCDRAGAVVSVDRVAWHRGNAFDEGVGEATLRPSAQLEPNPWGLFDMPGSVWEWTADWYGPYPRQEVNDPTGPPAGDRRTLRGGGFWIDARWARPAARLPHDPSWHDLETGFRVVFPQP